MIFISEKEPFDRELEKISSINFFDDSVLIQIGSKACRIYSSGINTMKRALELLKANAPTMKKYEGDIASLNNYYNKDIEQAKNIFNKIMEWCKTHPKLTVVIVIIMIIIAVTDSDENKATNIDVSNNVEEVEEYNKADNKDETVVYESFNAYLSKMVEKALENNENFTDYWSVTPYAGYQIRVYFTNFKTVEELKDQTSKYCLKLFRLMNSVNKEQVKGYKTNENIVINFSGYGKFMKTGIVDKNTFELGYLKINIKDYELIKDKSDEEIIKFVKDNIYLKTNMIEK